MTKQRAGRLLCPALTLLVAAGFAAPPSEAEPALKTFEVAASRYKYEPSTLEVEEGDRVVLRLRSLDIAHGLVVKEFKAKIVIPKGGEVVTLEFVAAKPGTFKFVCSEYCGRGHKSMKGQLVVRPRVAAGGPGGTNQPSPCTEQSGKVSDNHGHAAVITGALLTAGGDLTLDIRGSASHSHSYSSGRPAWCGRRARLHPRRRAGLRQERGRDPGVDPGRQPPAAAYPSGSAM